MRAERPMIDLTVAVNTPENISFEYQLAGPFRRLPAMLLDLVVRYLIFFAIVTMIAVSGVVTFRAGMEGIMMAVILISIFLLSWFYGLLFETFWNGQTPGKRAMQLRVVSVDGRPINGAQATIRNFVRVADFFPYVSTQIIDPDSDFFLFPTFLVALTCMLVTRRFQRLGDLAAGTMVVVDERSRVHRRLAIDDQRAASLAEYIPASFQMTRSMAKTLSLYVARRGSMSIPWRQEVASILAQPLLHRFGFRPDTSADLLLCALYYREFYDEGTGRKGLPDPSLGSPLMSLAPTVSHDADPLADVPSIVSTPS